MLARTTMFIMNCVIFLLLPPWLHVTGYTGLQHRWRYLSKMRRLPGRLPVCLRPNQSHASTWGRCGLSASILLGLHTAGGVNVKLDMTLSILSLVTGQPTCLKILLNHLTILPAHLHQFVGFNAV